MAGELYRGTAWWRKVLKELMGEYFGEMGPRVAGISKTLFEQQRPEFEDLIKQYYGGAAGLGQAVPGEGLSSTASEGLLEDVMGSYMADITGEAMSAYQMPWQAAFGQAPSPTARAGLEAGREAERMRGITSGFTGAMGGCCFIFIEADNGILNRIARRYRDEYGTDNMREGYKRLASWLVPLMREYTIIKALVKWTMVRPMIWWGKAFYRESRWGHIFYPVAKGWLKTFEFLGR